MGTTNARRKFVNRQQYAELLGGINKRWAEGRITLLDVAIANGNDKAVGLIDETATAHPEIATGAARSIQSTSYKTLVLVEKPTVGFRSANEGSTRVKGRWEDRRVECYHFNPRWDADIAVADSYEDGPAALMTLNAQVSVEASLQHICKQMWYGNRETYGNDQKGFPGALDAYDRTALEVDAGGSTALTSVYAIRWGMQDCQWVWGMNGAMEPSEVSKRDVYDSNQQPYTAYVQEIMAHVGFQVGRKQSIGRIKKIGTDANKGLTDALLGKLYASFPASYKPDSFYLTTRSLEQLRASRTATNPTGAEAPYPTDWNGVPLIVTDSIRNDEDAAL